MTLIVYVLVERSLRSGDAEFFFSTRTPEAETKRVKRVAYVLLEADSCQRAAAAPRAKEAGSSVSVSTI